jgi:hypothetical protein
MPEVISYDARVYKTEVYRGSRVTTYKVRWKVGGRLRKEAFRTAAQADSFRSALLTAARKGEAFSLATGQPTAWERTKAETTWYEFACQYVDMKWKLAAAKYRKDIARALTTATPALLDAGRGRPDDPAIRRALLRYGFNTKQRADPPGDVAEALAWIARHSLPVSALAAAAIALTWPVVQRRARQRAADHHVPASVDQGAADGTHRLRASLAPGPTPLRPPARLPVHLPERRRLPHPGRRMGGAQRRRTAADLRQMRRGPGRVGQAPDQRSPEPELTWARVGHNDLHFATPGRAQLHT